MLIKTEIETSLSLTKLGKFYQRIISAQKMISILTSMLKQHPALQLFVSKLEEIILQYDLIAGEDHFVMIIQEVLFLRIPSLHLVSTFKRR